MPRPQGWRRRGPTGTHWVLTVGLHGPQAPRDTCQLGRLCNELPRTRPSSCSGLFSGGRQMLSWGAGRHCQREAHPFRADPDSLEARQRSPPPGSSQPR